MAGEQAIIPQVVNIVRMLLPSPSPGHLISHSQLFGPTAMLYDLSKNGK